MIVLVLLATAQLSCAAVPMMRNIMDPQIIAMDEGFLYEVPEYEDPLVVQHQLSSMGMMPIFTLLESAKKRGNYKIDDLPQKVKIAESKKVIDEAMNRLEVVKGKLASGSGDIDIDIEKVIRSLKTLGKSMRPDMRQVLNSLQSIMAIAKPIMMADIKELIVTSAPEFDQKSEVLEKPQIIDTQTLKVRVISDNKPDIDEKAVLKNPYSSSQNLSGEKSLEDEEEEISEEKSKSSESLEVAKENNEATKPPFELKMKEKKNSNFDGDDKMSSYKAKLTWKAAGML